LPSNPFIIGAVEHGRIAHGVVADGDVDLVAAAAADERVVAGTADERIVAGGAGQRVGGAVAGDEVVERVAGAGDRGSSGQRQVLDIALHRRAVGRQVV
jgi:hypothetical protein